ncbi:MAG: phosphoribosylanthranilate isomerase [Bacteroidota bacterium]|nr:phosphoribosylanthranilate isomerase [Bacteroidota bacterium]
MEAPKVKICCISSIDEATLALRYGASALGLVSAMPSGPGPISEELIAEIVPHIPEGVSSFLLTSRLDADSIAAQQRKTQVNTLQLVDVVSFDVYKKLRRELPGISIVQVIHVVDESSIAEAAIVSQFVDYLLLDSGNPKLAIKELGGTGRKHDWNISKKIVESVNVPVFLAGGLNAQNVREAIEFVQPYGVDVCSGVRTNGELDEKKLKSFFEAANIF